MGNDVIKEVEQPEELERGTVEGFLDFDNDWGQRKRQGRRNRRGDILTSKVKRESIKRGAGSNGEEQGQGGRPSKARKFTLMDRN